MNDFLWVFGSIFISFVIGLIVSIILTKGYLVAFIKVRFGGGQKILLKIMDEKGDSVPQVGIKDAGGKSCYYYQKDNITKDKIKMIIDLDQTAIYRELGLPMMDVPDGSPLPYRKKDKDVIPHDPTVFSNILDRALSRKIPGTQMDFKIVLIVMGVIVIGLIVMGFMMNSLGEKLSEISSQVASLAKNMVK